MPSGSRSLLLRILVVILAALLGAALAEHTAERLRQHYTAKTILQMRAPFSGQPPSLDSIQGEITSKKILEPVLKSLAQEPTDTLLSNLQHSIRVRGIRHTELVEVGVTGTNSQVVATVANTISAEYVQQKIAEQLDKMSRALAEQRAEVAKQRQKVAALLEGCAEIRSKEGITDLNPDELKEAEESLPDAIAELRAQVAGERALNEKIAALSDAQILEEIAKDSPFGKSLDPTLTSLSTELKNLTLTEQKQAASGSGPEDLKLLTIRARKADLEKQLSRLVPILRKRLEARLAADEAKLRMAEELGGQKQPSAEAISRYREAKRLYLHERKTLDEMEWKLSEETIQRSMPSNPATIWEKAEPPTHPDRPPVFLLLLGLVLGLAVGLGLASLSRPGLTAMVLLILTAVATFQWWQAAITATVNSLYQAGIL